MSDRTKLEDGWDELLEAPARGASTGQPPTPLAPRVGAGEASELAATVTPTTSGPPKASKLAPPPHVGTARASKLAPPPGIGPFKAPTLASPSGVGPLEAPTLAPSAATPPEPSPRPPSTTLGDLRLPGPKPAPPRAAAFRLAPPSTVPLRPTTAVGLPPPPEFLPRGNSAELPLENQIRDETGPLPMLVQAAPRRASFTEVSDRIELDSLEIEVADDVQSGDGFELEAGHDPRSGDGFELETPAARQAGDRLGIESPAERQAGDSREIDASAELQPGDSLEIEAPAELQPGDSLEIEAPAELQPGDSMEVDLEISDDALPRFTDAQGRPVVPAKLLPSQLPATPARPAAAVPASAIPTLRAAPLGLAEPRARTDASPSPAEPRARATASPSPAEPRARATPFAEALPAEQTTRSFGPWIGVGVAAVLVLAVVAWLGMGGDEPTTPREDEPAVTPTQAAPKTDPEPTQPESEASAKEPSAAEPSAAEPSALENPDPPTLAEPVPDPDAAIIEVQPDRSAYQRAAADYEATGSHQALLAMTTAACALDDGPRARAAFRKLLGRALRTEAIVACRKDGVDVMANVEGHTGPELLAQARTALQAGDAQAAFDKAYASNKVERSSAAVLLQGVAACALGDADKAQRLMPHISKKARPELVERCRAKGITLRP